MTCIGSRPRWLAAVTFLSVAGLVPVEVNRARAQAKLGGDVLATPAGDVTGDGSVDVSDVVCTVLEVLWTLAPDEGFLPQCAAADPTAADVDCDGKVNVNDAVLVSTMALELPLNPAIDADGNGVVDACEVGPATGACCTPEGSCFVAPGMECDGVAGLYLGDGSTCETATCVPEPPAIGACCLPGFQECLPTGECIDVPGACVEMDPIECTWEGGTYAGTGTSCQTPGTPEKLVCPATNHACCLPDGSCIEVSDDLCTKKDGRPSSVPSCKEAVCPAPPVPEPVSCSITMSHTPPDWLPQGRAFGTPPDTPGNSVAYTIGVTPPSVVTVTLVERSSEPGVAINYGTEPLGDPDLRFLKQDNPLPWNSPTGDGKAMITAVPVSSITAVVRAFDWGAWGKVQACCIGPDGVTHCTEPEKLPVDNLPAPNGNHIADAWEPKHANEPATWDADWFPTKTERAGDGFSFYEEYRGIFEGISVVYVHHERLNPEHKDLVLYDQDWLHLDSDADYKYAFATWFKTHYVNASPQQLMNGTGSRTAGHRNVTHRAHFAHLADQFALHVHRGTLTGQADWGLTRGDPSDSTPVGPPATALEIIVDSAQIATDISSAMTAQGGHPNKGGAQHAQALTLTKGETDITTTHEMGHGTDVEHHQVHGNPENPYASNYSQEYWGHTDCFMRYDYDLVDQGDAGHPGAYGARTLANSTPIPFVDWRWDFSFYTDHDLSDLEPLLNLFCTTGNNCHGQLDVKDD